VLAKVDLLKLQKYNVSLSLSFLNSIVNKAFYALSNKSQEKKLFYPQIPLTTFSIYEYQFPYDSQKQELPEQYMFSFCV
jgi:hypothetical protein